MGILDGLLSNVDGIAEKLGVDPDQAKDIVGSLGEKLSGDGDKMAALKEVAEEKGISLDSLTEMVNGEEGLMGKLGGMLDRDGDGNPLNDIADMAKGFFGKK